ncbi:MAG TPA: response regulator transcription factor [Candidatus Aquilonibacter sp.]|nr:response regulator transcription factor [Candidatus Aquilonibacter sp.]
MSEMAVVAAPIRVYILEKHLLFAKAIAQALSAESNIRIAGLAPDGDGAASARDNVDVVVIDIDDVEDVDGTVQSLRARNPDVHVCALSMHAQPDLLQHCLSAGADAYIVKDSSLQELVTAINNVAKGVSYVDPRVAATYFRRRTDNGNGTSPLSPREIEIIRLVAQGLSNRDIGRRLVVSEKTVKNHISHIFSKLHISTRSQAAVHAIRHGLV